MSPRVLRRSSFAALCAAALVAGCAGGDKTADSAKMADSMAAAAAAATPTTPPAPALTDANILAQLDAAHVADSSAGNLASTMGTHADVKAFGKQMMTDHHGLRVKGMDLAKKLSVTPELPAGDMSATSAESKLGEMRGMTKGADWDKAYIDHMVMHHEQVLATAQAGLAAAQSQDLKDHISAAAPGVQAHLDKAKGIQSKLAAP